MAAPDATRPVRASLAETFRSEFTDDDIRALAAEIKSMTKKVWVNCPHCQKRNLVEVSDSSGKVKEFMALLEATEGKPGTMDVEQGGMTIVVERNWPDGRVADPV